MQIVGEGTVGGGGAEGAVGVDGKGFIGAGGRDAVGVELVGEDVGEVSVVWTVCQDSESKR